MRAAVLHEFGGELHIEERPRPEPGAGEVLVDVARAFGPTVVGVERDRSKLERLSELGLDAECAEAGS